MFGGLQVDDGHFPPFALGEERKVAAGFDLQGRAERERQVRPPGCRRKTHHIYLLSHVCQFGFFFSALRGQPSF